ncbi:unnamed protein product [Peronospora destructor]|uniref:MYND-type domain-containing protein n=1 Tax=Peronospora destructor TaxID=86335 RepID=A0AAV0V3S5_9STRA|nr:unnamed protein product [Peronospora destructor]
MVDSDSGDELMSRPAKTMRMSFSNDSGKDCAYCAVNDALVACTMCNKTFYCNETCKRRHARVHRNLCIMMRMEREAVEDKEDEESESDDDESDSESENVAHASNAAGRAGAKGIAIPALTPVQIKKLLDLATKTDTMTTNSSLNKLQNQMSQLMADKISGTSTRELEPPGTSLQEIQVLQEKLNELEKKTQAVAFASQRTASIMTVASVYTPLLRVQEILSIEGHGHTN